MRIADGTVAEHWAVRDALSLLRFTETARPTIALPRAGTGRPALATIQEGIALRGVGFRSPASTTTVLEDVSFTLQDGHVTALVGHNGAGTSTVVKLHSRLYDPLEGCAGCSLDPVP